jgi:hypothetical protein
MSGKTVLMNKPKVRELITSPLADNLNHPVGVILNGARSRLQAVNDARGCSCKKGPKRQVIYTDVLSQLKALDVDKLTILKNYVNATILNFGQGYQV